ncbi:MAG: hypothetical protein HY259_04905 [Chloroflexi bacterium]|nr:hypothetical protein [Chloroflexota bacterium]
MLIVIEPHVEATRQRLLADLQLRTFVDVNLQIPKVYCGTGEVRLIILGQDPTVLSEKGRRKIRTVLNLDRGGSLKTYLAKLCSGLGIQLEENVYATNLLKNFFVVQPTKIADKSVLRRFAEAWLPVLATELAPYESVPVITLGEPVLALIINAGSSPFVKAYWDYRAHEEAGRPGHFSHLTASQNRLGRDIFPFPHQPSMRQPFYSATIDHYLDYVRDEISRKRLWR